MRRAFWTVYLLAFLTMPTVAHGQTTLLDELEAEYKRLALPCTSGSPSDPACSWIQRLAQTKELANHIKAAEPNMPDDQMWRINKLRIETDLLATRVTALANRERAEIEAREQERRAAIEAKERERLAKIEAERAETERAQRIRSRGWPAAVPEAAIARRTPHGQTR